MKVRILQPGLLQVLESQFLIHDEIVVASALQSNECYFLFSHCRENMKSTK